MTTPFNYTTLGKFGNSMYKTLLYKHHLSSKIAKSLDFKEGEFENAKGYMLDKDNMRYLFPYKNGAGEDSINLLPIRVLKTKEHVTKSGDIIFVISDDKSYRSFRITADMLYTFKQLVDMDGIKHSSMLDWTLWKIVCWAARLARINIRVSAIKRFGKTSYIEVLNYLLDKAQVINRPRTVPGVCIHLNPEGLIALDEMGQLPAETRHEIQNILFQLGNFGNVLTLGSAGSSSYGTKPVYDIANLSGICLYNRIEDYKDKEHFFDFQFSNAQAINDRFLPLRPNDSYLYMDQFEDSQTMELTEENKTMFLGIMKSAQYYYEKWQKLANKERIDDTVKKVKVSGRHMISFKTILNFIDLYSEGDKDTYELYSTLLYTWYMNYNNALESKENVVDEINI